MRISTMSPKQDIMRVNLRISKTQFARMKEIARMRRQSLNGLFLSAVEFYLNDGGDRGTSEQYILSLAKKLSNLKVDVEIVGEMLSFFALHFFCYTPELPESQRRALKIDGKKRHAKFIELLAKRIQTKESGILNLDNQSSVDPEAPDPDSE
jgi:hypothetical protein